MVEFTHVINDKLGIHARPAGSLVQAASKLTSKVTIIAGDKEVDCKKLIALMRLGVKYQDTVTFRVEGENEEADCAVIREFCETTL